LHRQDDDFDSFAVDKFLECAMQGAMTPVKDYAVFWDAIINRMQFSVVDESIEGGAALFVFIDKLIKIAKSDPGLGP
jgi:hypothetical protein